MKDEENKVKVPQKKRKKSKTILIYALLLIMTCYIAYTIYLLIKQPTDTFTVEEGKLYLEETRIGYIIRDETVVKGENYKNGMEQIKTEGEKVSKDEDIYRYYSNNEENLKQKIQELDLQIQEIMESQTVLFSSDIKNLEAQIDEIVEQLKEITDVQKTQEYQKQISELITKKAKIAGELSPSGSYLNKLIQERSNYENQLNSGAEYIKAPKSGLLSYRVDGLEEKLTTADFGYLSKEYLEGLDLKTGKIVATSDECGKIIDNFNCYITTISDSQEAREAEIGDKVKIRLPSNVEVDAEIEYISNEGEDERLLVLKFDKQIEELISYRKISFDLIWWSDSGLKVPNKAIVEKDGLNYVVRNRAGYLNKLLVKIVRRNDKYSIVTSYTTDELKELGYSNSEINSYKKITIYDEILINPDLEKAE